MEPETSKASIFGKDISTIPCFRNSYLYGVSGGIAAGLLHFMFTSQVKRSTHAGFTAFCFTTLAYWGYCRHNYEKQVQKLDIVKEYLRGNVPKEGIIEENLETVSNI